MPVHVGVLWSTQDAARRCPKGDMRMAFCPVCGFVSNTAFDPALINYYQTYDNALHHSPFFQAFEESLVDGLIERYALRQKDIIEIGCGNGHFLALLCERGKNRGIGFDPSYDPGHVDPLARDHVEFIKDHYSTEYAGIQADLVCCRQVLEHMQDPTELLDIVRAALSGRRSTVVYFDVPNALMALRDLSIWDLTYEHCSYFTEASLRYLFSSLGFEILSVREAYHGQFLTLEARCSDEPVAVDPPRSDEIDVFSHCVANFSRHFSERRLSARANIEHLARLGKRIVIWGGGARTVAFFNIIGIGDEVRCIVDINKRKQGTYLAGTGHSIVPPEMLVDVQPDVVLIVNAIYQDEIKASVQELGLVADVISV